MEKLPSDSDETPSLPAKRLGRPPKGNLPASEGTEALADELESPGAERVSSTSPTLCRRSTRKKITKFDVLDVLNKSRKTHKIQIEARIDSNAPTFVQIKGATNASVSPTTSINRPIVPRPLVPTVLPLPLSEIIVKPKPTPSLIVAQVSSDKTSPSGSQQPAALRKRGRPRKEHSIDSPSNLGRSSIGLASIVESDDSFKVPLRGESYERDEQLLQIETILSDTPVKLTLGKFSVSMATNAEATQSLVNEDTSSPIIFIDVNTTKPETKAFGKNVEVKQPKEIEIKPSSNETEKFNIELVKTEAEVTDSKSDLLISSNIVKDETPEAELNLQLEVETDLDQEPVLTDDINFIAMEVIVDSTDGQPADIKNEQQQLNISVEAELIAKALSESAKLCSADGENDKEPQLQFKENQKHAESKLSTERIDEHPSASFAKDDEQKMDKCQQQSGDKVREQLVVGAESHISTSIKEQVAESTANIIGQMESKILLEVGEVLQSEPKSESDIGLEFEIKEMIIEIATEKIKLESNAEKPLIDLPIVEETIITDVLKANEQPKFNVNETAPVDSPQPKDIQHKDDTKEVEPPQTLSTDSTITAISPTPLSSDLEATSSKSAVDLQSKPSSVENATEEAKMLPVLPKIKEKVVASPSSKAEKPTVSSSTSSASNPTVVECDALFKVLDKANAQMRHEEKVKKKLKQTAKSQTTKQERSSHSSLTPPIRAKKGQSKESVRRFTVCEDRQDASAFRSTSKRRNSLHPLNAPQSPERSTDLDSKPNTSGGKRSSQKKQSRKGATTKQVTTTQETQEAILLPKASETQTSKVPTPTCEVEAADPLQDIAKFIEDGVKLLERDYKVDDDQQQQHTTDDEFAQRVANIETPATTPSSSLAGSTEDLSLPVRRSHRIKQKPQSAKSNAGRGSTNSQTPTISMEQQLSELAHIEGINEQFLRQEGINTFQTLRDNYYRCARQVSKENAEMQCDCFVTGDEETQGQLRCGDSCINRMLMIECGPLCTNADRCANKRFQQHQGWPCRVFRTEKKGCGITAELQIPAGEFIMEYVGEVIDSEEFERRQHLYSEDRNRHYYFMALRGEAIIDATSKGNISRYINHSCDPNAETQKWTVNGELRIGFFSVKTIMPGEEITFDYQYQRYGRDAQRCYCESANCRGWIGNEPESDEGEQLDTESDSDQDSLSEEPRLEQEQKLKAPRSIKQKKQVKSQAVRKQRKEQPKAKDREYKAGRWLRPSGTGDKSASRNLDMLEDHDVLEQLASLSRSGLKNQLNTLAFSRCMVRAKLLQTRVQLLGILTRGEMPCRRLFLDYHGLRLLHAWISENGSDNQLRLALLEALEALPIPNKTMLNDSRVYQSVELWSTQLAQLMKTPTAPDVASGTDSESDSLRQRILALLQKWNGLPEIFRIPKRERLEQMKEHEREADRQQLEESNSASSMLSTDRYRQDRFRRDTSSRYEKSKPPIRMSGNNTICTITSQSIEGPSGSKSDTRRRVDFEPRRTISKELRRSLFEKKVAQDEAEKRVGIEDWREHELRCEYFGADLNTDPKLLPHYQNLETKEWFNSENVPIPAPLRCGDVNAPPSPEHPDEVEYKLPPGVEPLPISWHWSMTPEGDIYYYNLRDRIPQWEPPNAEQRSQQLIDDFITHDSETMEASNADELINIDIDYVGNLSDKSLAQYIEVKIRERREIRRSRLVSVRTISPRREEDRVYNQIESRKYKENKEKIRRRKEIYRRTRGDVTNPEPETDMPSDSLPIHGYLYSSDEELNLEDNSIILQLDSIVDGDKSIDAQINRQLSALSPQSSSGTEKDATMSVKRRLPLPESQKKHRSDREKKRKVNTVGREAGEKFHIELSAYVADCLRHYRQESCQLGRIMREEDFKFLIKRLSHHITSKEMRYCEATGNPLACTESVKHKSYDFIKQYMRKQGPVYIKPVDRAD